MLMPFGGSALALIFYEFIFVKTQEYLNEDNDSDDGDAGLALEDGDMPKGEP